MILPPQQKEHEVEILPGIAHIPIQNPSKKDCYSDHKPFVKDIWTHMQEKDYDTNDVSCILMTLTVILSANMDVHPVDVLDYLRDNITQLIRLAHDE